MIEHLSYICFCKNIVFVTHDSGRIFQEGDELKYQAQCPKCQAKKEGFVHEELVLR